MGIRASHTAEVVLDDVRVPGSCLLGGKDKLDEKLARAREAQKNPEVRTGKQPAMATFEATRPAVAAQAVGVARAAYEYALRVRQGAGRVRQADHQQPGHRASCWPTWPPRSTPPDCWCGGPPGCRRTAAYQNAEGSMSKLKAGRTAVWVTERAIQILGGYGYVREYPVERWHRDAKIFDIFEGTEQIQQLVISRAISGLRIE